MRGLNFGLALLAPLVHAAAIPATVDLGYTIQQAGVGSTDSGMRYLNFTNVQYGTAHRFQPPTPPPVNRSIQTAGKYNIRCPQGQPEWLNIFGKPIGNLTDIPPVTINDLPPIDPSISEDCLFLDLYVPEDVFRANGTKSAAVLLWIHGGGFTTGWKSLFGPGVGLMEMAQKHGEDLIYISINYRLGLFGFLSDPDSDEITRNLGLQDQRFALEWVRKYIHLFGGDPNAITVMGESAGGGSVMYQVTSGNATSRPLFQRAIAQSPFTVDVPPKQQKRTLREVFQRANVTSFKQLRELPTDKLQIANALVVANARPYGTFVFAPVNDELYPDYPMALLDKGHYPDGVSVMAGHNTNEGIMFASPFIHTERDYSNLLLSLFPEIQPSALSTIKDDLYPADFSGKYGYVDQTGRVASTVADYIIVCNAYFLGEAFDHSNASFRYEFSVPPGLHGADLPYTFLDPDGPGKGVNATLAAIMQRYFTDYITKGKPGSILPGMVQNFNTSGTGPIEDSVSVERCNWWQKARFR